MRDQRLRLLQFGDLDVAVFALHLDTRVNLETKRSSAGEFGVSIFRGFLAIDPAGERITFGLDAEGVPFTFGFHQ